MSTNSRKEAIRQYKARKPQRGAFAVKCKTSGAIWVGTSVTLDTIQNRIWFGLRLGTFHDQSLQAEWNAHGEGAFEYEILARLEEDVNPFAINDLLKEQQLLWAERLGARTVL
jgi:hypothetical protein